MNRKIYAAFLIPVLWLASCSSMDVENPDSTLPDLPENFNAATYLRINPDIVLTVVKDSIKRYNAQVTNVNKAQEDSAFWRDFNTLYGLQKRFQMTGLVFYAGIAQMPDLPIKISPQNAADSAYNDSLIAATGDSVLIRDVAAGRVTPVAAFNKRSPMRSYIRALNVYGRADELSFIDSIPVDTLSLATQHYRRRGAFDGRPYTYCGATKGARKSSDQAIRNPGSSYLDYSRNVYCLDSADLNIYLNQ